MGAKFKCKKCKRKFDMGDGRDAVEKSVNECEKPICPLRNRALNHIPIKKVDQLQTTEPAANEETDEVVEIYEEIPIGGLISYKELRKKNGW